MGALTPSPNNDAKQPFQQQCILVFLHYTNNAVTYTKHAVTYELYDKPCSMTCGADVAVLRGDARDTTVAVIFCVVAIALSIAAFILARRPNVHVSAQVQPGSGVATGPAPPLVSTSKLSMSAAGTGATAAASSDSRPDGTLYFASDEGVFYEWRNGAWGPIFDLYGRGGQWFRGASDPGTIPGAVTGDFYLNTTSMSTFELSSTGWQPRSSSSAIPGSQGATWYGGTGSPPTAAEAAARSDLHPPTSGFSIGDMYLDGTDGAMYAYESSATGPVWTRTGTARGTSGPRGGKILHGTTVPTDSMDALVLDKYVLTMDAVADGTSYSSGTLFVAEGDDAGGLGWKAQHSIVGPGLPGATGDHTWYFGSDKPWTAAANATGTNAISNVRRLDYYMQEGTSEQDATVFRLDDTDATALASWTLLGSLTGEPGIRRAWLPNTADTEPEDHALTMEASVLRVDKNESGTVVPKGYLYGGKGDVGPSPCPDGARSTGEDGVRLPVCADAYGKRGAVTFLCPTVHVGGTVVNPASWLPAAFPYNMDGTDWGPGPWNAFIAGDVMVTFYDDVALMATKHVFDGTAWTLDGSFSFPTPSMNLISPIDIVASASSSVSNTSPWRWTDGSWSAAETFYKSNAQQGHTLLDHTTGALWVANLLLDQDGMTAGIRLLWSGKLAFAQPPLQSVPAAFGSNVFWQSSDGSGTLGAVRAAPGKVEAIAESTTITRLKDLNFVHPDDLLLSTMVWHGDGGDVVSLGASAYSRTHVHLKRLSDANVSEIVLYYNSRRYLQADLPDGSEEWDSPSIYVTDLIPGAVIDLHTSNDVSSSKKELHVVLSVDVTVKHRSLTRSSTSGHVYFDRSGSLTSFAAQTRRPDTNNTTQVPFIAEGDASVLPAPLTLASSSSPANWGQPELYARRCNGFININANTAVAKESLPKHIVTAGANSTSFTPTANERLYPGPLGHDGTIAYTLKADKPCFTMGYIDSTADGSYDLGAGLYEWTVTYSDEGGMTVLWMKMD